MQLYDNDRQQDILNKKFYEVVDATVALYRLLLKLNLKVAGEWFEQDHPDYDGLNDPQDFVKRVGPACLDGYEYR